MELNLPEIPCLKVEGISYFDPKIDPHRHTELYNGVHLKSDDEEKNGADDSIYSPLSSQNGRNDDSRSSNDLEETSFEGGYLYHHDRELSAGDGDEEEGEGEEDSDEEYEIDGLDYPDEEDLMELEDCDPEDDEEEEEEKEDVDSDHEQVEGSQSEGGLAQLHSALQELSQTHSNVRYINRTYPRSPTDEMLSPSTTLPTTRRRSISSSLSSLVSGIRRATTDRNPRRGISSYSVTHPSNLRQVAARGVPTDAAGVQRRGFPRATNEDYESSSPIPWGTSLQEIRQLSPTKKNSPIRISTLLTGKWGRPRTKSHFHSIAEGELLKNELLLRKTISIRSHSRQLLKQVSSF